MILLSAGPRTCKTIPTVVHLLCAQVFEVERERGKRLPYRFFAGRIITHAEEDKKR